MFGNTASFKEQQASKLKHKIIWRIHFSHKKSQSSSVNQVKVSPAAQHGPGSWELVSGLRTGDSQQWADFRSRAKWEHFGGLRTVYHFTVGIISNCIRWSFIGTKLFKTCHVTWHWASCVTHFRAMMSNWSCSHVHTFPPTHSLYCWEMMGLYICVRNKYSIQGWIKQGVEKLWKFKKIHHPTNYSLRAMNNLKVSGKMKYFRGILFTLVINFRVL